MSREIKFRGKSVQSGKWLYGYLGEVNIKVLQSICKEKVIFENLAWFNTDNFGHVVNDCSVDESTIGQFTGLTDKNGKEIYEGDILMCIGQRADNKGRKYYRKVLFDNGSFCMTVPEYKMLSPLRDHVVDGKLGWEVIGNIYDNPELISKED